MNLKTAFFTLMMFVSGVVAFGAPVKMTVVSDATRGIYKVVYKTSEMGKVKVSIFNDVRELVFVETITNVESFVRPYNFNSLPQGEYTIVVEDKNGRTEEKVNYFFKKVESKAEVTKIANEAGKYLVSIENKESDLIEVRIIDAENNVLHDQTMTVNGKFSVIYNLTKVKGEVSFEVIGSNGRIAAERY